MKKYLVPSVIVALVLSAGLYSKAARFIEIKKIETQKEETLKEALEEPQGSALLEVGFICQAPLQTEENWKHHEESCEEAATLQTILYERGETITPQEADQEILAMIEWQEQHFGGHFDLYADQMKEFITQYFWLGEEEVLIIRNTTLKDIQKALDQGHPVIAPTTAGLLNNPYYPEQGYHMLVITGYTTDSLITNDNGTRRGEDFTYKNDIFMSALNDAGGEILILHLDDVDHNH